MEAIVLAGGFGTRLKNVVTDLPKPMVPVCGKPFLEYILSYLEHHGITRVVLAVGYMREKIIDYFGDEFNGLKIEYSIEDKPLLTGGAIKQAILSCKEENVFVINGDTYFDVELKQLYNCFVETNCQLGIAIKHMNNFERYGTVILSDDRITKFCEKKPTESGYINGGIYIMKRSLLERYDGAFSFEKEVMEKKVEDIYILGFPSDGYFIDIGIPEDYAKAQLDFQSIGMSL